MRSFTSNIANRVIRLVYPKHAKHQVPSPTDFQHVLMQGGSVQCRVGAVHGRVHIGKNTIISSNIILERDQGMVSIGNSTYLGASNIICACDIFIGNDVLVSWGCTIVDHDSHSLDWKQRADDVLLWRQGLLDGGLTKASQCKKWDVVGMAPIRIEDKAWIGMNTLILKGVVIGQGGVVAAGSVVTKDVAPWTLVAGNPAKFIKEVPKYD